MILSDELVFRPCVSQPLSDAVTSGGALLSTGRIISSFPLSAVDRLRVESDEGADTQVVTVRGMLESGWPATEALQLAGTAIVRGAVEFAQILDIELSAQATGVVVIKRLSTGTTIVSVPEGTTRMTTLFKYGLPRQARIVARYEKLFVLNTSDEILHDFVVKLHEDSSESLEIGLATAVGDSVSVANRLTAPSGVQFLGPGVLVGGPECDLDGGESIGLWIKQTLTSRERILGANAGLRLVFGGGTV